KRTPGVNCYLQRAREAAADAGIVVVNHALLLQDARMRGALLPQADHVVIDEAHRLEDVATDAFGLELYEPRLRRDLQRVAHSLAVTSALRDPARAEPAERIRADVERALERTTEVFNALGTLLVPIAGPAEDRIRITGGVRASDDRWLPVELAGERLADAIAGIAFAAERIRNLGGDEDELAERSPAASAPRAARRHRASRRRSLHRRGGPAHQGRRASARRTDAGAVHLTRHAARGGRATRRARVGWPRGAHTGHRRLASRAPRALHTRPSRSPRHAVVLGGGRPARRRAPLRRDRAASVQRARRSSHSGSGRALRRSVRGVSAASGRAAPAPGLRSPHPHENRLRCGRSPRPPDRHEGLRRDPARFAA